MSFEYTDDLHPRNTYWDKWGHPMFDIRDAKAIMGELKECRLMHGECYIRLCALIACITGNRCGCRSSFSDPVTNLYSC